MATAFRSHLRSVEDTFRHYYDIVKRLGNEPGEGGGVSEGPDARPGGASPGKHEPIEPIIAPPGPAAPVELEDTTHTVIEEILIELGNYPGYDTYTVDASRIYGGRSLAESMTVATLPRFAEDRIIYTAKEIDVIWFENGFPVYAFEVEHTTGFAKGLQRLYQLRYFKTKFFVVASGDRENKYQKENIRSEAGGASTSSVPGVSGRMGWSS